MAQQTPAMAPGSQELPAYHYTMKWRWSVKLNFMSGVTLLPWLRLLWEHAADIDWLVYPHRVLFLTVMAIVNTLLALPDWLFFSRAVARQPLHPSPVFVLGHPRTGTTHLHNLLSCDPRFAFATTFHAGFPSSFLTLEPCRGALSGLLEPRRPMDAMALHWDLPAEDEIAVNLLTCGDSPYMQLVFPRLWRSRWRPYLTFGAGAEEEEAQQAMEQEEQRKEQQQQQQGRGQGHEREEAAARTGLEAEGARCAGAVTSSGTGDGLHGRRREREVEVEDRSGARVRGGGAAADADVAAAFERWRAAFMWFMKKVTYRTARRQPPGSNPPPLLVKSPVHTARLGLWRRMFPAAKFIYVHRHPVEVFQSAANMADTYYWYTYLQRPTDNHVNDFIMDQYEVMHSAYLRERGGLPPSQLVEVRFEELDSDPLGVLRRVYGAFGWEEHFEAALPRFRRYVKTLADFKKNHFNRLSPEAEAVVRRRWAQSFGAHGYH